MLLTIKRIYKGSRYTIGHLYIDGLRFCDTLEDRDRGLRDGMTLAAIKLRKIWGKTAVPTGSYRIDMHTVSHSMKSKSWAKAYRGIVPRLVNVKGFEGVLIHPGNTDADTAGCVLVGENKVKGKVVNSVKTYHALMAKLLEADGMGETITLEIR